MAGAKEGVVFARNGIENTGFAYAFSLIEGKCKLPVLFCLYLDGTTRYNELKRKLAPATYKSLTSALRGLVADGIVERVAVGIRDRADIIGALGAPLDLQTRDAGRQQLRQVIDHAHVAGVEDVRPARVLRDVKHLAGALGLREAVLPAACLLYTSPSPRDRG